MIALTALALLIAPLEKGTALGPPLPLGPPPDPNRREFPYVGSLVFQGISIDVETAAGEIRRGQDADGSPWHVVMPWHYGEVPGTLGLDGDAVDVLVGPDEGAAWAYVVHTRIPGTWVHDEDKVLLGFPSAEVAEREFRRCYNRTGILIGVTRWPMAELRERLLSGAGPGAALVDPDRVRRLLAKGLQMGLFATAPAAKVETPVQVHAHVRHTAHGVVQVTPHLRLVETLVEQAPVPAPVEAEVEPPPDEDQVVHVEIDRSRWGSFLAKMEALQARARKIGVPEPTYTVTGTRIAKRSYSDGGFNELRIQAGGYRDVPVTMVEITRPIVQLPGGWRYMGTIETRGEAGNLYHGRPGATRAMVDRGMVCDHCGLERNRKRVHVLRSAAGQMKAVGGECTKDYLGRLTPGDMQEIDRLYDDAGMWDDFSGEGQMHTGPWPVSVPELMTLAARIASVQGGFVSRKHADLTGSMSTADIVRWALYSRKNMPEDTKRLVEDAERLNPAQVEQRVKDVTAWLADLPKGEPGDFLDNLRVATGSGYVDPDDIAIAVAAFSAMDRARNDAAREARKLAGAAASMQAGYLGQVGDKIREKPRPGKPEIPKQEVVVEFVTTYETAYGSTTLVKMRNAAGQTLVWRSSSRARDWLPDHVVSWPADADQVRAGAPAEFSRELHGYALDFIPGARFILTGGTVKKHGEFRGELQTEISRAKLQPIPTDADLWRWALDQGLSGADDAPTRAWYDQMRADRDAVLHGAVRFEDLAKAPSGTPVANRPGLVLRPAKSGGARRWQKANPDQPHPRVAGQAGGQGPRGPAPQALTGAPAVRQGRRVDPGGHPGAAPSAVGAEKKPVHDEPMPELGMQAEEFNALPRAERARRTASWPVVKKEIDTRFAPQKYQSGDHSGLAREAQDHLDKLSREGWISKSNLPLAHEMLGNLASRLQAAGVSPADSAKILDHGVRTLAHQEHEAVRRTIGDHGIRHLHRNVQQLDRILDAVDAGGSKLSPRDRLAGVVAMMQHDLGYTIPTIARGGFAIKDDYHPSAGKELWHQQVREDPVWERALGGPLAEQVGEHIRLHSAPFVDWKNDPLGTGIRLADNTHLFADKMPEVLFSGTAGMETMLKLHLAKQMGVDWKPVRDSLVAHIKSRTDIEPPQRDALLQAAQELSAGTPKFLISRLAGRDATFEYDADSQTMEATIQQSPLRRLIGEVFGDDETDKQFTKMLKDYGMTPEGVMGSGPPPRAVLEATGSTPDGKARSGKVALTWAPPGETPNALERRYLETAQRVLGEAQRAKQAGGDELTRFFATMSPLAKALGVFTPAPRARLPGRPGPLRATPDVMDAPRGPDGALDLQAWPDGIAAWVQVAAKTSPLRGASMLVRRRGAHFEIEDTRTLDEGLAQLIGEA